MEGKCSVCSHASRGAIDHALVQRAPYRDIARRFGVSKDAPCPYSAECVEGSFSEVRMQDPA